MDKDFDYDKMECSIKVHFFEFPERWDEWYKETDGISKIAPFLTYADEPKDKCMFMPMMHRKKLVIGEPSTPTGSA